MSGTVERFGSKAAGAGRLWWALGPALVVPLFGALCYFLWFPDSGFAWPLYSATKAFTLLWPLLAWRLLLGRRLSRPGPPGQALRALPLGVVSGLLLVGLLWLALQTPLAEVATAGVPAMRARVESFGLQHHYWLFALGLSLLHSALEEYYWRWFVFGRALELMPAAAAHLLAALAFAAHHVVVAGVFFGWGWGLAGGAAVAAAGLLWSVLYRRQGSLFGAWVSHVLVDLGLMAVGYRLLF